MLEKGAELSLRFASGFPLVICDPLAQTHEADATAYILFADRNQFSIVTKAIING